MTEEEIVFLAYTAGFFDADGTVGIYWTKRRDCLRGGHFSMRAGVTQKRWQGVFGEWQRRWGGTWFIHDGYWRWGLRAKKAAVFLRDILPHLGGKAPQVKLALEFQRRMKPRKGVPITDTELEYRRAVSEALKEMKQTAEEVPSEILEELERQTASPHKQLELWMLEEREEAK